MRRVDIGRTRFNDMIIQKLGRASRGKTMATKVQKRITVDGKILVHDEEDGMITIVPLEPQVQAGQPLACLKPQDVSALMNFLDEWLDDVGYEENPEEEDPGY